MRKFIVRGIIFIGTSALLYIGLFFLFYSVRSANGIPLIYYCSDLLNWKGGRTFQTFREFDPNEPLDIVFIGSSHAYRGYDPRIFAGNGYRTFNLGSNAQTPINTWFVANQYADPKLHQLILLDLYPGIFESEGFESAADLAQNIASNPAATKIALATRDPRAINMLTLRFLTSKEGAMYQDSTYMGRGYSERTDSVRETSSFSTAEFNPAKRQLRFYKKLLQWLTAKGFNVVAVRHPAPKETSIEVHDAFMRSILPDLEKNGIPFLDFTFDHTLNSRDHFYDHHHLNQAGVKIFNEELIAELIRSKILVSK